jgi:hypothetical protein
MSILQVDPGCGPSPLPLRAAATGILKGRLHWRKRAFRMGQECRGAAILEAALPVLLRLQIAPHRSMGSGEARGRNQLPMISGCGRHQARSAATLLRRQCAGGRLGRKTDQR